MEAIAYLISKIYGIKEELTFIDSWLYTLHVTLCVIFSIWLFGIYGHGNPMTYTVVIGFTAIASCDFMLWAFHFWIKFRKWDLGKISKKQAALLDQ